MTTGGLVAADERPHPSGASSSWTETWELRLVDAHERVVVVLAVTRRPAARRASYIAAALGEGRDVVAVIEHEIALPADGLELRGPGIWADHVCEDPFVHWSVGLEAFGLTFEDPDDAVTTGRGDTTPLGFDLEWEDDRPPAAIAAAGDVGYLVSGRAHGELLVGPARLELDGVGHRLHRWGTGPQLPAWWSVGDRSGLGVAPVTPAPPVARAAALDADGAVVAWQVSGRAALLVQTDRP